MTAEELLEKGNEHYLKKVIPIHVVEIVHAI